MGTGNDIEGVEKRDHEQTAEPRGDGHRDREGDVALDPVREQIRGDAARRHPAPEQQEQRTPMRRTRGQRLAVGSGCGGPLAV